MRVGVVTCAVLPEPDPDQELLLTALAAAGAEAQLLPWDEPDADPGRFDLCVLRSSWNYYEDPAAFGAWLDGASAATTLLNPVSAVRWNLHKTYLRELEAAGVPVVPTAWVERGTSVHYGDLLTARGWHAVVIKPCISASSFRTQRFGRADADAAQSFLDGLAEDRDTMVQRYMPSVEGAGERSLVWIDGALTHAVRKTTRFAGADESISEALPIADDERALAEQVLDGRSEGLLYARVDIMRDDGGNACLSELEIIEPSLFLMQCRPALDRLVSAIVRHARLAS